MAADAELVFGFVYAVGTNADPVASLLKNYLKQYNYGSREFRVSEHLRTLDLDITFDPTSAFDEMNALMNAGNQARAAARTNDILAAMAVNDIADRRSYDQEGKPEALKRVAHLVRSLKTSEEVRLLREIYRPGFFLIGIASDEDQQRNYLTREKGLSEDEASLVMERDQDEKLPYGQRTRDTFYLADVFVELTGERYKEQLERFLELVFSHPFKTPTREEHAMFMAYASAARSAQFGRQVGASVTSPEGDVVAVGFNEVPSPAGGPYWETYSWEHDTGDQRDHVFGDKIDSNYLHRCRIVDSIVSSVQSRPSQEAGRVVNELIKEDDLRSAVMDSELKDITEYGRAVHAEMDALLTCARLGIPVRGKKLFVTTFPCHNCTRHIIAAGISSVTYIEPYPKSRAAELHKDAICFSADEARTGKIPFLPFVGIGPRRYLDLFSFELSTGGRIERKDNEGKAKVPARAARGPRVAMLPLSYLEREAKLLHDNEAVINELEGIADEQTSGKSTSENEYGVEPPANG